ncbi:DNA-binding response regulator [Spirochaetia bacterium]|nr:DNA-binding response regulator [Spirochaetia bacterium]
MIAAKPTVMPTVLVVDDEEKILDIVKSYLEKSGYEALCAGTGREAMALLKSHAVSLILLDLMLPDFTGEELCRKVRSMPPPIAAVPIIMMTAKVDEASVIRGLNLGADDYVTKPFSPRQLMARVAAILRRSGVSRETGPQENCVLSAGGLTVDQENRRVSRNGEDITLTPNEYKILSLLMSSPRKIFTREEIISAVKSDEYDGFDRAVDSHIKNLRQKIEEDSKSPRYVLTVYGMGYRFGEEVR